MLTRSARWAVVTALLLAAAPPLSPAARATTPRPTSIRVTPTHASDGEYFTAEGVAACGYDRLMVEYDTYAGNHTAHGTDWEAPKGPPPGPDGWPYKITVRVPHTSRPGSAVVYVAPYCDPEGFEASDSVPVRIDLATVRFTVTPPRPRAGDTVTVTGTGCYGTTSATAPVEVRWANGAFTRAVPLVRPRTAQIGDGHGITVRTTVPPGAAGTARVTLLAGADCPGTALPAAVTFPVLPPRAAPGTARPATTAPATHPPVPTPPATATPAARPAATTPAPVPTTAPTAVATAPVAHRRVPRAPVLVVAAVLAGAGAFGVHRLRRPATPR
ncbi:MAG TPA: hypothetical protein VFQ85_10850 [Mycobacteriales bacterium]|jgi:hypothetical protein|nr:hypothetical protein [Mycobacteriales bacterium]